MRLDRENDYPVVVVVAFQRESSLRRLLRSLTLAYYDHPIRLVISIDKGNNQEVLDLAQTFEWKFGEKEIICHPVNLGTRAHILECGDLTNRFSKVIVLEDDLLVSPIYYRFAEAAFKFYDQDDEIAGISLCSTQFNPQAKLPYKSVEDDGDVYFVQYPSSWGQAWSKNQWQRFRQWYKQGQRIGPEDKLPKNIKSWPETSWVKYFAKYLVDNSKYFVYPRVSVTTNFGESGVHFGGRADHYQVPLLLCDMHFRFKSLNESIAIYDAFFEIETRILNKLVPKLKQYDYLVDLNAGKPLSLYHQEYVLTVRATSNRVATFGLRLVPFEMNVILGIQGTGISLAKKENVRIEDVNLSQRLSFFYSFLSGRKLLKLLMLRIKHRLF